ncbi:hypothetical protein JYU34_011125 [Plutella xylostella]|uniref:Uncharacterized protein n=1 Tax=Plutella xylostella TaxID=51655 RepID=A0ABQ7QGK4_PLUXY|nr:hypothetical protein JYU34_011125 [Plutella xylostella]
MATWIHSECAREQHKLNTRAHGDKEKNLNNIKYTAAAPALKLVRQARLKAATALKAGSSQRRSSPSTRQAGAESSTTRAESGRESTSASPTTPAAPAVRSPANYAAAAT